MIGKIVSHYKILDELGSGGMGVVYEAEDLKLKRVVALKFLPTQLTRDGEARGRFIQEAQAASALDHPNICTVHEIDETDDGQMFIAMACYRGETLDKRIERAPLPIDDAVAIAAQIACGLAKAHSEGIIHRDIKPANVFVTDDGQIKILDFGLAKLGGQTRLTKEGTTLGTVAHMSPEQTSGSEVDHRADIWALGVVLYEMISGKLPFVGDHEQAVMYSIINSEPEPLTAIRTGVPMELERVVHKCLEKNPADRYQHIDDVIVDLNRHTKRLHAPYEPSADRRARVGSGGRWMAAVIGVLAIAVVSYAVYWQWSLPKKKIPVKFNPGKMMLVVLPFENLGPPDVEYFTDGVTEEITSRLAALSGLGVISRTSAFQYKGADKSIKQIGEELGVNYVLEGTVRWDQTGGESRVRVTPQLIRVADDTHLWSERYDRVLEDIFAVQTEIATQVIERLNVTLLETERTKLDAVPTNNMEAYHAYLRGRDYMSRAAYSLREWRLAIEMFEHAVALDPEFALAYTDLANAHSGVFNAGVERTPDHIDKCKAAVDRALELQPDLPEARVALGYYYYHCFRDYDRAVEEFQRAAASLPNQNEVLRHIGWIRRRQSRWDEALAHLNGSLALNPRDANLLREIGNTLLYLRRYDEAMEYYDRSIAVAPDQAWTYGFKAVTVWVDSGDLGTSRRFLEQAPGGRQPWIDYIFYLQDIFEGNYNDALERMQTSSVKFFEFPDRTLSKSEAVGYVYYLKGDSARARSSFETAREDLEHELTVRPEDSRVHSALGPVYAILGLKEEAIRAAKRGVELTPVSADALRGPRFVDFLAWSYALTGDHDAAVELIDYLLSIPSVASVRLMELDARWDPLRGDPKFQAVLEKHSRPAS